MTEFFLKSDIGGVILGIRNEKELRNAYKALQTKAGENHIPEEDFAVTIRREPSAMPTPEN